MLSRQGLKSKIKYYITNKQTNNTTTTIARLPVMPSEPRACRGTRELARDKHAAGQRTFEIWPGVAQAHGVERRPSVAHASARRPLQQLALNGRQHAISKKRQARVSLSQLNHTLLELHHKTDRAPLAVSAASDSKITILQLGSMIKDSRFCPRANQVNAQRYYLLSSLVRASQSLQPSSASWVGAFTKLVEWFRINRFDYVIRYTDVLHIRHNVMSALMVPLRRPRLDAMLDNLVGGTEAQKAPDSNASILSSLYSQQHSLWEEHQAETEPHPTHIVEHAKRIGVFMVLVECKNLATKLNSTVLLANCDDKVSLQPQDLIVLPKSPVKYHVMGSGRTPFYMTFRVLRE